MKRWTLNKILVVSSFVLLTYMIIYRTTQHENTSVNRGTQEAAVKIVIVDEHHTVLPYWYEASWKSGIEKFTLIHIDGHSDFGPFAYFKNAFQRPKNRQEIAPYMQRNDVFVQGAVAGGLIEHFIWVWPEWSVASNLELQGNHTYGNIRLGWFDYETNDLEQKKINRGTCFCGVEVFTDGKESKSFKDGNTNCIFALPDYIPYEGPAVECHYQKQVKVTFLRSITYKKYFHDLQLREKKTPIILDIDEDYYACEKGSDVVINVGINWTTIENINIIMEEHTAPHSIDDETQLNITLTKLLTCSLKIKCVFKFPQRLTNAITDPNEFQNKLLTQFRTFTQPQIATLKTIGFCLGNSPITTDIALNRTNNNMMVCTGYNEPDSQNSDFYTTTRSEVLSEGRRLQELYEGNVKLVTISRSYRDGYVQRNLQPFIENDIIKNLRKKMKVGDVHYDENVLAH